MSVYIDESPKISFLKLITKSTKSLNFSCFAKNVILKGNENISFSANDSLTNNKKLKTTKFVIKRNKKLINIKTDIELYKENKSEEEINNDIKLNNWNKYFNEYYTDISQNTEEDYDDYVINSLKLINLMPEVDWTEQIKQKRIKIGSTKKDSNGNIKKTLILDMDETLIHLDADNLYDEGINLKFNHEGEEFYTNIILRPYLNEFLEYVSAHFEVIIFTASCKDYADTILDYIDPLNKYFSLRLYRESCLYLQPGIYIKDLTIFEDRSLDSMIIVDNSLLSFANQLNNGILVSSFYFDKEDDSLDKVKCYLEFLMRCQDVQLFCEEEFKYEFYKDALYRTVRSEIRNKEF